MQWLFLCSPRWTVRGVEKRDTGRAALSKLQKSRTAHVRVVVNRSVLEFTAVERDFLSSHRSTEIPAAEERRQANAFVCVCTRTG
jgi:hypothetical protein